MVYLMSLISFFIMFAWCAPSSAGYYEIGKDEGGIFCKTEQYGGWYPAVTKPFLEDKISKSVSRDFFDMVVIDECHRGSAADDSAWRKILDYFSGAIQLGMTTISKEAKYVSNLTYFCDPVYTYSIKQGIADGFLAPFKVVRIDIDKDLFGWKLPPDLTDDLGQTIEDRTYNQKDMDRILVLNQRTKLVPDGSCNSLGQPTHRPRPLFFAKMSTMPRACGPPSLMQPASWQPTIPNMSCESPATARRVGSGRGNTERLAIPGLENKGGSLSGIPEVPLPRRVFVSERVTTQLNYGAKPDNRMGE